MNAIIALVLLSYFVFSCAREFVQSIYNIEENTKLSSLPEGNIGNAKTLSECANACLSSGECTAANYLETEGKCYLKKVFTIKDCDPTEISVGWTLISLPRREFIFITNQKKTWSEAQAYCAGLGGQLVRIYTSCENAYAKNLTPRNASIWIDGTDAMNEGSWLWSDGLSVKNQVTFDYWGPGQPNNYQGEQHCLCIYRFSENVFEWADENCSNKYDFLCEK